MGYQEQKDEMLVDLFRILSQTTEHAMDFDKKSVRRDLNIFNKALDGFRDLTSINQPKEGVEEDPV